MWGYGGKKNRDVNVKSTENLCVFGGDNSSLSIKVLLFIVIFTN